MHDEAHTRARNLLPHPSSSGYSTALLWIRNFISLYADSFQSVGHPMGVSAHAEGLRDAMESQSHADQYVRDCKDSYDSNKTPRSSQSLGRPACDI